MKRAVKCAAILALVFLTGCVPFWRQWMREGKGEKVTPATYSVLQKHEDWCYNTLGAIECYPGPQRGLPPESLVNVNPPSRYPLTRDAYMKAMVDYESQKK